MSLVCRAKITGLGRHYGVYLEYGPFHREVLELQADVGLRAVSLEGFARGRPLTHELELAGFEVTAAAWQRVRDLVANPPSYDFLQRNCEHVARRVMLGESKSPQISGLVFVASAVAVLALFSKAG
jgi:hypothetical protein